ncbi:hypothetical protein PO878_03865 [Iamia majanohamensis]|uniref:Uncharacterized protein n=1 Tax=Iamia majanohamensis TaxID=467976 RepID=A0AAE9YBA6_9ACTN|nr:hypothetical protein [Iamia majanohamensis]WCO67859.1 hypothetical protein PO878_03865 [Iamia majanohamensis]
MDSLNAGAVLALLGGFVSVATLVANVRSTRRQADQVDRSEDRADWEATTEGLRQQVVWMGLQLKDMRTELDEVREELEETKRELAVTRRERDEAHDRERETMTRLTAAYKRIEELEQ